MSERPTASEGAVVLAVVLEWAHAAQVERMDPQPLPMSRRDFGCLWLHLHDEGWCRMPPFDPTDGVTLFGVPLEVGT